MGKREKTDAQLLAEGGAEVEIGSETFVLWYDYKAIVSAERELRKADLAANFNQFIVDAVASDMFTVEGIFVLAWAALQRYDRWDTPEDFGNWFMDVHRDDWVLHAIRLNNPIGFALSHKSAPKEPKGPLAKKPAKKAKSSTHSTGKGSSK